MMPYSLSQINQRRNIPIVEVLTITRAACELNDRHKWHTVKGAISVTGQKFMNWNMGRGGYGAIDLVIHLLGHDFITAADLLMERFHHI